MQIGHLLKRARNAAGVTQQQVADHFGINKTSVSEWENDKSRPDLARLEGLASLYRCSITDLLVDGGPDRVSTLQPILAWEHEDDLPPGEFVLVPRLDVHLSAGHGTEQVELEFSRKAPLAFRTEWIRENRLKPKKLAAMTASGDSMEREIYDGDSLLVDTSRTEVVDGKVYALWFSGDGGGERVKRLFRLPGGGLKISSDNPVYPAIELGPNDTDDVRVIGRVMIRSGRGGL